jgi:tetratricopeptide (TPR) repeat protein
MSDIGFNDNLNVAGRTFHFQTSSNSTRGVVNCEIYENGTLMTLSEINFERRKETKSYSHEDRMKKFVESLHREMMTEIELLFLISEKVKKLRHSPSNCKMGLMFLQNNLIDEAIKQFELAIKNDSNYLEAYNNLGLTYIQTGEYKKAIQVFKQAIEKGNPFADLHNNYGFALLKEHDFRGALKEFQEALKLNSDYIEANYNLALLYFESTLYDKSDEFLPPPSVRIQRGFEQLQRVKKFQNKQLDIIYPKLDKFYETKNYKQISDLLNEAKPKVFIRDTISLIGTSFYLKFMYGGKGLDNEIIEKYEKRLELALNKYTNYADIWNNLGIVHLIQCRNLFLQALGEFKRALEINPAFEKARKNKRLVENDGKEFLILLRAILK